MTSVTNRGLFEELEEGDFRTKFQETSYKLMHGLAHHPAFSIGKIIERVREQPREVHYDMGDIRVDQRWDEAPPRNMTVEETLRNIEKTSGWVFLKNAHKYPAYNEILEACFSEAERLAGRPLRKAMRNQEMILFVTSPNRVSSYHIDRECSFLLQVEGSKTIHTFDGRDRSVLQEEEIEKFWTVDNNAPRYREETQSKAKSFKIEPGTGVHIPVNHPHWLKNDDNVSISVNINFQFPDSVRANIYRTNYYLRRLGLTPVPPGRSAMRDKLKAGAFGTVQELARRTGLRPRPKV